MKNKQKLALLLAAALPLQGLTTVTSFADTLTSAQSQVKTFGGSGDDVQKDMAVNADGSYVILLHSTSVDQNLSGVLSKKEADDGTFVLVKYGANHVMQWAKSIHLTGDQYGTAVVKSTSDNGYMIAGSSEGKAFVQKLNATADQEWITYLDGSGTDSSYQVVESADHNSFIVVGTTNSNDGTFAGMNDYKASITSNLGGIWSSFIVKLNASNGDIVWKNVLDGKDRDDAKGVVEQANDYLVIGGTESRENDFSAFNGHGSSSDIYFAKLDKSTGELVGTPQSFGDEGQESMAAYLRTSDGGYLVSGYTDSTAGQLSAGTGNGFLAKFDQAGTLVWSTRFGSEETWPGQNIVEVSPNIYSLTATDYNGSQIYTFDATDVNNITITPEAINGPIYLYNLYGTSGQWFGAGYSGGELGDVALDKGGDDVAIFHTSAISNAEAVVEAANSPAIQYGGVDSQDWVTENFTVNTKGILDTNLGWTSDNSAITISGTGEATVTRPPVSGSDVNVTLTATASLNGEMAERKLTLTVKKQSSWGPVIQGNEENQLDFRNIRIGSDGAFYILNQSEDGDVLEKKGPEDTDFTALPSLPVIENSYSAVTSFDVSGTDIYVTRIVVPDGEQQEHYEMLKLGNDDQWTAFGTEVPEELAPAGPELGEFTGYRYSNLVVDKGTVYLMATASYLGGDQGSTTREIIVKWNGTEWVNVTPNSVRGIMQYTVRDGKIYALAYADSGMDRRFVIQEGGITVVDQLLTEGETPAPYDETAIAVDSEGAIYLLDGYGDSGKKIWKGVLDQQTVTWKPIDDAHIFTYPQDLAVSGTQLYVLDVDRDTYAPVVLTRSTVITDTGNNNPSTGGPSEPNTDGNENSSGSSENPTTGGGENSSGSSENPTTGGGENTSGSSNNSNSGSSNTNTTQAPTASSGTSASTSTIPVVVNGQTVQVPAVVETKQNNGHAVKVVSVDNKKLMSQITEGKQAGNTITIPVSSKDAQSTVVELNAALVKAMGTNNSTLEVKTDQAAYLIPAKRIIVDDLLQNFGADVDGQDVKISILIESPSADQQKLVDSASTSKKAEVIAPAVSFEVTATYNGSTKPVNSFTQFVERRIPIPAGVDPSKITTGVVVDADGTMRHVPTKVLLDNGVYYAQINSLTNSLYSVVWHPIEFSDMNTHWAKEAVNDLGSRMVVEGDGQGNYEPTRDMTRAEFTAILVRGLGLKPVTGDTNFADVDSSAWYASSVTTAVKYNLIKGISESKFAPTATITRQEAMTMIARAAQITELSQDTAANAESLLQAFQDAKDVQAWARDSVAFSLENGLVNGISPKDLAPKADISRAEVAVMLERLLKKSDLI
ncbi:S-layer homology domain-containing protein [Paenibacillus aurantiacus]|uniref:S-layer homology domain-containing protein n=1 Tax=Paenibacillus aurantiacus TaxID=1936118 RepID=A0ABV5KTY2_9BACL